MSISRGAKVARRKFLYWAVLLLSTVSVSLLLCEMILRSIYREEEINGDYFGIGAFQYAESIGYVHAAGYQGFAVRRGVFVSPVSINSLGLRQKDLARQLSFPHKLLILGDSFVFGLGVAEEQTFVSQVGDILNSADIGVVNGGQAGFSVEQERLFGIQLIERIHPNIVVIGLFAQNDIMEDYYKRYRNIEVRYGYRLRKDRLFPVAPIDYLRTHSYLWMFTDGLVAGMRRAEVNQMFRRIAFRETRAVIQPTLDALVKMNDYCKAKRIAFGILMIPQREGATPFDRYLRTALEVRNIAVMDLNDKQYSDKDYFHGDGHWNTDGHMKTVPHLVTFANSLLRE